MGQAHSTVVMIAKGVRTVIALALPSVRTAPPSTMPDTRSNCKLLELPAELRLQVYSYMTLNPASPESLDWKGAYLSCRTLQTEMLQHLNPNAMLEVWVANGNRGQPGRLLQPPHLQLGYSFGLADSLTIRMPLPTIYYGEDDDPISRLFEHSFGPAAEGVDFNRPGITRVPLQSVYGLYFNHVHVIVASSRPYSLKGGKAYKRFLEYVQKQLVHCRAVTFTVEPPKRSAKDNWVVAKPLAVRDVDAHVNYTLTITLDRDEAQVRRTYASPARFEVTPPLPETSGDATETPAPSLQFWHRYLSD